MKTILFVTAVLMGAQQALAAGCVFNGKSYAVNATIPNVCIDIICTYDGDDKEGHWEVEPGTPIDCNRCDNCEVYNDPHIIPFDVEGTINHYNYHGLCRYALAEYVENLGPGESTATVTHGTYADFKQCDPPYPTASCLDVFSYQVGTSANTVVNVKWDNVGILYNNNNIDNNEPANQFIAPLNPTNVIMGATPYNLLAWKDGSCSKMLGPDFFAQVCEKSVNIWTTVDHQYHLGGLCGKYDGTDSTIFTHRDGTQTPWNPYFNAVDMGNSWKTDFQFDTECKKAEEIRIKKCVNEAKITKKCQNVLKGYVLERTRKQTYLKSCVEDICMDPKHESVWLKNTATVYQNQAKIQAETKPRLIKV